MSKAETLDKVFLDYLKEIQRTYVDFPKIQRLRLERWIQKLAESSTPNPTWKVLFLSYPFFLFDIFMQLHRNAYAKFLLSQILARTISDPFHESPPDGPLPSFPSHHKHKLKSVMGVHESSFWRDIYDRIHQTPKIDMDGDIPGHRHSSTTKKTQDDYAMVQDKEIRSMSILIKEQATRIDVLEKQLQDERLQHELEIQRIYHSNRAEIGRLKQAIAASNSVSSFVAQSPSPPMASSHRAPPTPLGTNTTRRHVQAGKVDESLSHNKSQTITSEEYLNGLRANARNGSVFGGGESIGIAARGGVGEDQPPKLKITSAKEDDDYLQYLQRFQIEMKNLQLSGAS